MNDTQTQAQAQFIEDFLLVSENDYDTYLDLTSTVKSEGVLKASEKIQEQFENWITQLADQEEERGNEYGSLLLRQLLIGWGSDSYYKIAKHFEGGF
jgi:uncharacterized protein HemY